MGVHKNELESSVTTKIDQVQRYEASPAEVFTMLADEDFVEKKCLASGSIEASGQILDDGDGKVSIIGRRVLPAQLPGFAKKFVGDTIVLTETQNWDAAKADGDRRATFVVDFGNNPISFKGTIALLPDGDDSTVETKGEIKCTVPFVGGKIEQIALSWIDKYLNKEQSVGNDWLADKD